nr:protein DETOXIFICATION 44, chloroplastic-like [Arachis hypogaea]
MQKKEKPRDGWLKFDELGKEILSIALPAALPLAADPLTSLIDTTFVGHIVGDDGYKYLLVLGSVCLDIHLIDDCCCSDKSPLIIFIYAGPAELAAVGVSTSVFNLVSKIFNIPLLNITTSFVAEEQALISKDSSQTDESNFGGKYQSKRRIPSVSTSLALAATLGIPETVLLSLGSGIIMNIMGIPAICQPWLIIDQ